MGTLRKHICFNMQVLENIEKFIQQAQNLRSASPGLESLSKSELTPRILIQNAKDLLKLHDELILQVENFVKGDYHKFYWTMILFHRAI